jgi:hypothetical protein
VKALKGYVTFSSHVGKYPSLSWPVLGRLRALVVVVDRCWPRPSPGAAADLGYMPKLCAEVQPKTGQAEGAHAPEDAELYQSTITSKSSRFAKEVCRYQHLREPFEYQHFRGPRTD